jgi:hypothetical protein
LPQCHVLYEDSSASVGNGPNSLLHTTTTAVLAGAGAAEEAETGDDAAACGAAVVEVDAGRMRQRSFRNTLTGDILPLPCAALPTPQQPHAGGRARSTLNVGPSSTQTLRV